MSDMVWLNVDIINIRFEYLDTKISDGEIFGLIWTLDSDSNTVKKKNIHTVSFPDCWSILLELHPKCQATSCRQGRRLLRRPIALGFSTPRLTAEARLWILKEGEGGPPALAPQRRKSGLSPHGTDIGQTYNKKSTLYDNRFKQRYDARYPFHER